MLVKDVFYCRVHLQDCGTNYVVAFAFKHRGILAGVTSFVLMIEELVDLSDLSQKPANFCLD